MSRKKKNKSAARHRPPVPPESRPVEVLTVFWAVTLVTLLMIELLAVAVHLYIRSAEPSPQAMMLYELLLFAGLLIGIVSLVLLGVIMRLRIVAPPMGLVVFGACLAMAPLLAFAVRLIQ